VRVFVFLQSKGHTVPKLSEILPWLDAHAVAIGAVLAAMIAAWKAIPAKTREAIERAFPRVAGMVRFVVSVGPDVLGALRIGWYQVLQGVPRESVQTPVAPTAPPAPIEPDGARTQTIRAVGDSDRGLRGFSRRGPLVALAFALGALVLAPIAGALLSGCPLPPADGCTPLATRCSPEGVPQSCSPSQRWTSGALQRPCAQRAAGSVCCRARSPYGTELYACVPQSVCLPETSADAGAEGGDQ